MLCSCDRDTLEEEQTVLLLHYLRRGWAGLGDHCSAAGRYHGSKRHRSHVTSWLPPTSLKKHAVFLM